MVEVIWFTIAGSVLLFVTASFDYYTHRIEGEESKRNYSINTDTDVDLPPIGSSPESEEDESGVLRTDSSHLRPITIGYLVALLLQIPAVFSLLEVI